MKFWRMQQEMVFMYSVVHPEFFCPLRHYQPRDTVILETLKDSSWVEDPRFRQLARNSVCAGEDWKDLRGKSNGF